MELNLPDFDSKRNTSNLDYYIKNIRNFTSENDEISPVVKFDVFDDLRRNRSSDVLSAN